MSAVLCEKCHASIKANTDDNYNMDHSKIQCDRCGNWQLCTTSSRIPTKAEIECLICDLSARTDDDMEAIEAVAVIRTLFTYVCEQKSAKSYEDAHPKAFDDEVPMIAPLSETGAMTDHKGQPMTYWGGMKDQRASAAVSSRKDTDETGGAVNPQTEAHPTASATPRDCKHGQLARSCEICTLERECAGLKRQLSETTRRYDESLDAIEQRERHLEETRNTLSAALFQLDEARKDALEEAAKVADGMMTKWREVGAPYFDAAHKLSYEIRKLKEAGK